ncbi:hypothetical protein [Halospeciosus flavus]|uniref:Hydrogenase maturation nickel metallochaperone HypA n=1 Tax=Halospeciosus flavus TaxID=3032283 RepID=A0ABD5Z0J0_9EURY|nr:hypothetical protein [Halospeciosus flavus]
MSVIQRLGDLLETGDTRYRCTECESTFDTPRHGLDDARCPSCGSPDIER